MTRLCGYTGCHTLIVVTAGATSTNRCIEHQGQRAPVETDEQRIARVCAEMGWRRGR